MHGGRFSRASLQKSKIFQKSKNDNFSFWIICYKKFLIVPVYPFYSVYVPIDQENRTKMRILLVFNIFMISKKRYFRSKSSILTLYCLPDRKIFAYKFFAGALNFPKIDWENRKSNKNKIGPDPLKENREF